MARSFRSLLEAVKQGWVTVRTVIRSSGWESMGRMRGHLISRSLCGPLETGCRPRLGCQRWESRWSHWRDIWEENQRGINNTRRLWRWEREGIGCPLSFCLAYLPAWETRQVGYTGRLQGPQGQANEPIGSRADPFLYFCLN